MREESTRRIEEGEIFHHIEESGLFPPMVTQMIAVGEETVSFNLFDQIASFYEEEAGVMTKGLSSLIEPLMLMLVGVVVGGMLISLYFAYFYIYYCFILMVIKELENCYGYF